MGAAFRCRLSELPQIADDAIIGRLTVQQSGFTSMYGQSVAAWAQELSILRTAAKCWTQRIPTADTWTLLLEYEIPLRNRRPDAVLIADDMLFVLEFKVGETRYRAADLWQVCSYGLDLRDFHAESRNRWIVPVLIATDAPAYEQQGVLPFPGSLEQVATEQRANRDTLADTVAFIHSARDHKPADTLDPAVWEAAAYRPTPTIIEAAERLFAGQHVADISHHGATNLTETTDAIVQAIEASQRDRVRTICFVTGVPGAGKTLAGLNAVHDPRIRRQDRPTAMFLSGNGPLVRIITEALTRDCQRAGLKRQDSSRKVAAFIANVHTFLKHHVISHPDSVPSQHAIIFDEAQRAWSAEAVKKKHGIAKSEPALILDVMSRAPDWCTVVALIGGGQEINQGEAGLEEWGRALNAQPHPWRVMIAPHLLTGTDAGLAGHRLFTDPPTGCLQPQLTPALHLAVSVRSPRARMIGDWVNHLLDPTSGHASVVSREFPIVMTRSIEVAKAWLRERAEAKADGRVVQRVGLLTSSGAMRLRADGIEVSSGFRQGYPYTDWFLNSEADLRSSMALEVAATEFECQGLELDWTCICWGGDFVIGPSTSKWVCRQYKGTAWQNINTKRQDKVAYTRNKYRVLLTRARRGMIIWVPEGASIDPTRDPGLMNATAEYLRTEGVSEL